MKKLIILVNAFLISSFCFAQKGKVTNALSLKEAGKIAEAFENINIATDPDNEKSDKTLPWPKTWEVRGEIFQAIYKSNDASINNLAEDPLTKALESYKKALELDEKGKFENSLKIRLTFLMDDLSSQAVEAWKAKDYKLALESFEKRLEINNIPIIKADNPNLIDTAIIYNAALAANACGNYKKAIKYFSEAAEVGYNKNKTYLYMSSNYKILKDTTLAFKTIQEGFEKYPDDSDLMAEMINIYIQTNKRQEALEFLKLAMKKDPNNPLYFFVEGRLKDELGEKEAAIESYKKSLEIDDSYFNSSYNLGALYFNKGVEQFEIAGQVPQSDNKKYQEELAKCDQWWDKALPPMEKCLSIIKDESQEFDYATKKSVLETLKNIYYRMMPKNEAKWKTKYEEMTKLINSM